MMRARYRNIMTTLLLGVLVLSPLPSGSNDPFYWLLSAMVIFTAAAIFMAGQVLGGQALGGLGLPAPPTVLAAGFGLYLLFLIWQILTGVSMAPRASSLAMLRVLGYGVFFYLMLQIADRRWILHAVFASVVAYALLGFVMRFGGPDMAALLGPDAYPGSASGPFVNRNSFAGYLGFGLLTGLALLGQYWRRAAVYSVLPVFYLAGLAVVSVVLLASNSRMGLGAALLGLLALGAGAKWRGWLAAAALGLGGVLVFGAPLWARLDTLGIDTNTRLTLYRQVLDMIAAQPWRGVGLDSFAPAFQGFHQAGLSADLVWDKAHNSYLASWAETGLVFGSLPALLGVWLLVRFARNKRWLGVAVLVLAGTHSMVDFNLEIQANMYVFLALLAAEYAALPLRSPQIEMFKREIGYG